MKYYCAGLGRLKPGDVIEPDVTRLGHNYENGPFWDVDETQECGWMSKGHWDDFVYFIKNGLGGVSKDKDTDTE